MNRFRLKAMSERSLFSVLCNTPMIIKKIRIRLSTWFEPLMVEPMKLGTSQH